MGGIVALLALIVIYSALVVWVEELRDRLEDQKAQTRFYKNWAEQDLKALIAARKFTNKEPNQ